MKGDSPQCGEMSAKLTEGTGLLSLPFTRQRFCLWRVKALP